MAFFVEVSRKASKGQPELERIDLELIAIGKKAGLAFSEINEFRVRDLLAYVEIFTGSKKEKPRMATQEDIDRLLA